MERDPEKSSFMAKIEREKREAFLQLEEVVRDEVLRLQYYIPFVKLLAIAGALQSPLQVNPNEQRKFYFEEGRVFRVYCFEDMLMDSTKRPVHHQACH
jgi:hypothetical protein